MNKKKALKEKGAFDLEPSKYQNWEFSFNLALKYVKKNIPLILYGPPGTGKTKMIDDIIGVLNKENLLGKCSIIQFHKKFSYEDFIEGFVPSSGEGFIARDGVFKEFCKKPTDKEIDLFIVDEINRAELSTTLGECLYLFEDRANRKVYTSHLHEEFSIPVNLSFIGTMNTADRNIAIIDYALRRRFQFIPVFPDASILQIWLNSLGFDFQDFSIEDYVGYFQKLNAKIKTHPLMGHHMQIGHTMFVPVHHSKPITIDEIIENFQQVILAQIEAYCGFGNEHELAVIFNPHIATKYLNKNEITMKDFTALINATENEQ